MYITEGDESNTNLPETLKKEVTKLQSENKDLEKNIETLEGKVEELEGRLVESGKKLDISEGKVLQLEGTVRTWFKKDYGSPKKLS